MARFIAYFIISYILQIYDKLCISGLCCILDGYVYSYPTVQAEISGGRSQITGDFTVEEAKDLANILKSGKLPAPARIIEEAIVGPSLGEEAISSVFGGM